MKEALSKAPCMQSAKKCASTGRVGLGNRPWMPTMTSRAPMAAGTRTAGTIDGLQGFLPPMNRPPTAQSLKSSPTDLLPSVRVGVWLMPDNQFPGELEDFVRHMLPGDDRVWPRAESYIDGIPQADRRFRDGKVSRAQLYAWLATRELPGRMGAAINAGDLNTDVDLARRFVSWLHALFS